MLNIERYEHSYLKLRICICGKSDINGLYVEKHKNIR